MRNWIAWIGGIGMLLFAALGTVAAFAHSAFFIDSLLCIAAILLLYRYRHRIIYSREGAFLVMLGGLMNVAGVLGTYDIYYGAIGWDKMLHVAAMGGVTLLAYGFLRKKHSIATAALLALLVAEGIGALNEVTEFLGTYYFAAGQGLFGMQNGLAGHSIFDQYDTLWDMVFNTLGIAAALLYAQIVAIPTTQKAATTRGYASRDTLK